MEKSSEHLFESNDRKEIVNRILRGMDHREFVLFYQPIVSTETLQIVCAEALVRWEHPQFGILEAKQFIEYIDGTDLIIPFGYHLLKILSEDMKCFKDAVDVNLRFNVNASARQLVDDGFEAYLEELMKMYDHQLNELIIEITEYESIRNFNKLESVIFTLKDRGVDFALDDFGTGYSALQILNQLPVSFLKIDKAFIPESLKSVNYKVGSVFESMIQLCQCIDVKTIVEGIENKEQEEIVRRFGADMMQGDSVYKPLPISALITLFGTDGFSKHIGGV